MKISRIILLTVFISGAALFPVFAQAATLSLVPQSSSYAVGSLIPVDVYVSSSDQAMNAVSAVISYPKDKLEIAALSKDGSIINLWVRDPSISATLGQVNFSGVVLNPGFIGNQGKLLTIVFRARASGSALVGFNSGSVLANDGSGTNILTSMRKTSFSIVSSGSASTTGISSSKNLISIETGTTSAVNTRQVEPSHIIFSAMDILALFLSISTLVIGLVLLWFYGLRRIRSARRRLKAEAREAHSVFQKSYEALKGAVQEHLDVLTKKHGKTKHDPEIVSSLQRLERKLDAVEESIQKEIYNVEEDLR